MYRSITTMAAVGLTLLLAVSRLPGDEPELIPVPLVTFVSTPIQLGVDLKMTSTDKSEDIQSSATSGVATRGSSTKLSQSDSNSVTKKLSSAVSGSGNISDTVTFGFTLTGKAESDTTISSSQSETQEYESALKYTQDVELTHKRTQETTVSLGEYDGFIHLTLQFHNDGAVSVTLKNLWISVVLPQPGNLGPADAIARTELFESSSLYLASPGQTSAEHEAGTKPLEIEMKPGKVSQSIPIYIVKLNSKRVLDWMDKYGQPQLQLTYDTYVGGAKVDPEQEQNEALKSGIAMRIIEPDGTDRTVFMRTPTGNPSTLINQLEKLGLNPVTIAADGGAEYISQIGTTKSSVPPSRLHDSGSFTDADLKQGSWIVATSRPEGYRFKDPVRLGDQFIVAFITRRDALEQMRTTRTMVNVPCQRPVPELLASDPRALDSVLFFASDGTCLSAIFPSGSREVYLHKGDLVTLRIVPHVATRKNVKRTTPEEIAPDDTLDTLRKAQVWVSLFHATRYDLTEDVTVQDPQRHLADYKIMVRFPANKAIDNPKQLAVPLDRLVPDGRDWFYTKADGTVIVNFVVTDNLFDGPASTMVFVAHQDEAEVEIGRQITALTPVPGQAAVPDPALGQAWLDARHWMMANPYQKITTYTSLTWYDVSATVKSLPITPRE